MTAMSISRQQRRAMQDQAQAVDQAVEGDRRFFGRFPNRSYRVRLPSTAKRAQIEVLESGVLDFCPEDPIAFVVLKQIVDGLRLKAGVCGPVSVIDKDLTEDEARSVWEGYAAYHPEVSRREADLLVAIRRLGVALYQEPTQ